MVDVSGQLRGLGKTAREVATKLLANGFRGVPNDCRTCPVTLFVESLDGVMRASVMKKACTWTDADGVGHTTVLPGPVEKFVREYDDGEYPALALCFPKDEAR